MIEVRLTNPTLIRWKGKLSYQWWRLKQLCYPMSPPRQCSRCRYGATNVRDCGNQRNGTCKRQWTSCAQAWYYEQARMMLSSAMNGLRK